MTTRDEIGKMLGDLIAQASLDIENDLLNPSPETRRMWDAIVDVACGPTRALRRMWADSAQYGNHPSHPATGGYRDAVRDLAHELGVDLDE